MTTRNLPVEILCDIFLRSLPSKYEVLPSRFISTLLNISHVSRHWRDVSLSCGELWSHLYIVYDHWEGLRCSRPVFDTWLSRTLGSPLNFVLRCDTPAYDADVEYIITTLLSLQHRWKNVDFTWNNGSESPGFMDIKLTNMPLLKSLEFTASSTSHDSHPHAIIDITSSSQLRSLILRGEYELSPITESFSTVVKFASLRFNTGWPARRKTCSFPLFLNALRIVPFVTELRIRYVPAVEQTFLASSDMTPISSRSIRAFSYAFYRDTNFGIDYVTLPSLEALQYINTSLENSHDGASLLNFVQRSLPPLTFLEVVGSSVEERNLIPILRLLGTLKELRVCGRCVSAVFFEELTFKTSSHAGRIDTNASEGILCPALVTLEVDFDHFTPSDTYLESMVSMAKSRRWALGVFKRAKIGRRSLDGPVIDMDSIDFHAIGIRAFIEHHPSGCGISFGSDEVHPYPFTKPI